MRVESPENSVRLGYTTDPGPNFCFQFDLKSLFNPIRYMHLMNDVSS